MARVDGSVVRVEVVYCPGPGEADQSALELRTDATVRDALLASGVLGRHREVDLTRRRVGVWGRLVDLDAPLSDGDRVEIYRPLLVDPMQARRARHARLRGK